MSTKRGINTIFLLAGLSILFLSQFTAAQITTGTILGVVKDSTGGVLPGVTVTALHLSTRTDRTTVTDDGGRYRIPQLPLGAYEVRAELTGFQTTIRRGITLAVGQEAVIDISMNVGEMTEQVEVTGEAPQIETTTSTIAGLVDEKKVRDLPLNARSLIELAPLKTGVVFADTGRTDVFTGFSRKISIAGSRGYSSLFQLDGSSITDRSGSPGSAAGLLMGVETIREFNVVTNAYSSEYGSHTGGVFNAVTKSGTNEIHGSVFEFLRNDNLDARNFFDGAETPEFKRNQFGFSLGGPIVENQTFAFGSYEALRENFGIPDIWQSFSRDALRGFLPDPARPGQLREVGVADNVKSFLSLIPQPNGRDFGNGSAEIVRTVHQKLNEDFFTLRLDHNFSDSDTLFARYTFDDATRSIPRATLNTLNLNESRNQYFTLGETHIFSPQLVNKFTLGVTRAYLNNFDEPLEGYQLRSFTRFSEVSGFPIYGTIAVQPFAKAGFHYLGSRILATIYEISSYFQLKDDLTFNMGKHSLKFGGEAERRLDNRTQGTFVRAGLWNFLSPEDFLRGRVFQFLAVIHGEPDRYFRQTQFGFYIQDDIKLTPRLTMNLGLRYEPATELTEKYGRISGFRQDWRTVRGLNPADATVGNPLYDNPSLKAFAPRIGFAWDPWGDSKTAVRAGFGVFHDQLSARFSVGGDISVTPLLAARGVISAPVARVPIDFPNAYFSQNQLLGGNLAADVHQFDVDQPYVMKWSLDIQRQLMADTMVEVGYTGSRGVHLPLILNTMNVPQAQLVDGRLFIPQGSPLLHPRLDRLRGAVTFSSSSYHALRLELNRRFAERLQFQFSYTFSKSLDDGSSALGITDFAADTPGRYLDIRNIGLSGFDVKNNLTFNFTYDLPGKNLSGVAGKVFGGWAVSGIGRFADGYPFTLTSGALASWMLNVGDYVDRNPAVKKPQIDARNVNRYYDASVALLPNPGFVGNMGRNVLRGPGVANFDLVLSNNIKATERVSVQFRAEFFNLFNRANFGQPDTAVFDRASRQVSPRAGRISSTTTTSRQIQFALKLVF
ncbi:MAG: TonB-dependent receptor [Acidobacteria bacterium]|nr:TonB-dependent receptor [Acidobacteriota bacterium]